MDINIDNAHIVHIESPIRTGGVGIKLRTNGDVPNIGEVLAALQAVQNSRSNRSPLTDGGIAIGIADQLVAAVVPIERETISCIDGQHIQNNILASQVKGLA